MFRTRYSRGPVRWLAAAGLAVVAVAAPAAAADTPTLTAHPVKTSPLSEFDPAADGPWVAWASNSKAYPARYAYYVQRGTGPARRVNAWGTQGSGGGLDGHFLAYIQQQRGRAHFDPGSVVILNMATGHRTRLPDRVTKYGGLDVTIALPWVLFTRAQLTATGGGTIDDVVLYNRRTGEVRRLAAAQFSYNALEAGQVNGDWATWAYNDGSGYTITRYRISTRTRHTVPFPRTDDYGLGTAVAPDGTVYFLVRFPSGTSTGAPKLMRYTRSGDIETVGTLPKITDISNAYLQQRATGARWIYLHNLEGNLVRVADLYQLTVSKPGTGTGTVTSSPARISCGSTCTATFRRARVVTLTAVPDLGSMFGGWSEPGCGTARTCSVIMIKTRRVTATFTSLTS